MAVYKKSVFVLGRPAFNQKNTQKIGGVIVSSRILVEQFERLSIPNTVVDTYRDKLKFLSLFPILLASIKRVRKNDITFLNINEREIIFLGVFGFFSNLMCKKSLVRFFGVKFGHSLFQ